MCKNNYKSNLIKSASDLDNALSENGRLTKLAEKIIDKNSKQATKELLKTIGDVIKNTDTSNQTRILSNNVKETLIKYQGYIAIKNCYILTDEIDSRLTENQFLLEEKLLPELLQELEDLVGLKNVKEEVNSLIAFQKIQNLRKKYDLENSKNTLHLAFTGNPGTGKTTVARIVGHIYKQLGLLSKGHFIEASRTDLIASYQGQTAMKVHKLVEKAKGGVLFIDEAYSITENEHTDSYGRECITELTKALEDYRDDLVVIVAGYTKPMEKFFSSNPGLKSRFNTFIEFNDYDEYELATILEKLCINNDYLMNNESKIEIQRVLKEQVDSKDEYFANGRLVRNIYDNMITKQAQRLAKLDKVNKEQLIELRIEDI